MRRQILRKTFNLTSKTKQHCHHHHHHHHHQQQHQQPIQQQLGSTRRPTTEFWLLAFEQPLLSRFNKLCCLAAAQVPIGAIVEGDINLVVKSLGQHDS
jgi:hypothetical protein